MRLREDIYYFAPGPHPRRLGSPNCGSRLRCLVATACLELRLQGHCFGLMLTSAQSGID